MTTHRKLHTATKQQTKHKTQNPIKLKHYSEIFYFVFSAPQHISLCYSALCAIARPSVYLSVTRVDQSKTVEVRIMQPGAASVCIQSIHWIPSKSRLWLFVSSFIAYFWFYWILI